MPNKINYLVTTDGLVEKAIGYLPDVLRDKEKITQILSLIVEAEQENYNLFVNFAENMLLDAARGWWLDTLAEENGIVRFGEDDEAFRGVIKAVAGLPYYKGTGDSSWDRLSALFNSVDVVLYVSLKTITVFVKSSLALNIVDKEIFKKFFPAGADIRVVRYSESTSVFRFGTSSPGYTNSTNTHLGKRLSSVYFRTIY